MKDLCPHNEEPQGDAEGSWPWDTDGQDRIEPPWSNWPETPTAGGTVKTYGDDDDFTDFFPYDRHEEEDPDHDVLADGRPVQIPPETRDRLWIYGFYTLKRMIRDGEIFEKCAAKDRPLSPSLDDLRTLQVSAEDRDALAGDTLADAMDHVEATWCTWSPDRGAKLETYFIGGLTLYFPAVFRKWQRNRWRLVFVPAADAAPLALRAAGLLAGGDPGREADLRTALQEVMRLAGPEVRAILSRTLVGETQDEIAEYLESSSRAVEGRLYRFRRRLQAQGITAETLLNDGVQKGWQAR
ncbi:RNA polymerase sigma factor sigma-70 region 4 domain-containing protein [Streptomyces mirabilis]|uniref:hypothetical protein n=1 Tax=Streptomyces mirabilis TaxID=68239 RepID=UPI00367B07A1